MERQDGHTIRSVADVKEQDTLSVTVWDGIIEGVVTRIEEKMEKENGR